MAAPRSIRAELLEVVSKQDTIHLDSRDGERLKGLLALWRIVGYWVCESRSRTWRATTNRAVKMNVLVLVDGLVLH